MTSSTAEKINALNWGIRALEQQMAPMIDDNDLLVWLGVGVAQKNIHVLTEMKTELEAAK